MAAVASNTNHVSFDKFDEKDVYIEYEKAFLDERTHNIVIDFDATEARAAKNLTSALLQDILQSQSQTEHTSTKWIIIFGPERQPDVIEKLKTNYDFSPRLYGLMCTDPEKPIHVSPYHGARLRGSSYASPRIDGADGESEDRFSTDTEKGDPGNAADLRLDVLNLNHYRIVDDVSHYCSIDWGSNFLCIGYNSLCGLHTEGYGPNGYNIHDGDRPNGTRVWTWLILCDDGTVISMHETPFNSHNRELTQQDRQISLKIIRQNLGYVFKQLSKANDEENARSPITRLPIRSGPQSDAPSLLFYYLFDDWYTGYSMVTDKKQNYGRELSRLRHRMFEKPAVELIENLHRVGQHLVILQRLYQSYALIVDRILERHRLVDDCAIRRPSTQLPDAPSLSNNGTAIDCLGVNARQQGRRFEVPLGSGAAVRFERMKDRIQLYALCQIQDWINEKESLVFLNFNLITLKESHAVERLTRITILLAKVTILFMPVSLMTAYFSVQVKGLANAYDSKTYWTCFAVIMSLSFVFLIIFGKLSGTLEGKPVYRSMSQAFGDLSRRAIRSRKPAKDYLARKSKTVGM